MREKVVASIERVLVAVESVEASAGRWLALGFRVAAPRPWRGCRAADIDLPRGGIRLISPARADSSPNSLARCLRQQLQGRGEGLSGWTWSRIASAEPGTDTDAATEWAVDPALTPGAITAFESDQAAVAVTPEDRDERAQRNRSESVDHIVIVTGDVNHTASVYEQSFSLHAHGKEMKGRRFAFLKVGTPVIEITGPLEPDPALAPAPWGLALRSRDLEETVAVIRATDTEVADPKPAIQGGRIVSLREPFSGVPLAWLGK